MKRFFKFLFALLIAFTCVACGGGSKLDYELEGKYAMENPKSEGDKEFSKVEISKKGKIYTIKVDYKDYYAYDGVLQLTDSSQSYIFTGELIKEIEQKDGVKVYPSETVYYYDFKNSDGEILSINCYKNVSFSELDLLYEFQNIKAVDGDDMISIMSNRRDGVIQSIKLK